MTKFFELNNKPQKVQNFSLVKLIKKKFSPIKIIFRIIFTLTKIFYKLILIVSTL
jgi:hypothetical protein